jgi:hypothetical protein
MAPLHLTIRTSDRAVSFFFGEKKILKIRIAQKSRPGRRIRTFVLVEGKSRREEVYWRREPQEKQGFSVYPKVPKDEKKKSFPL